MLVVAILIDFQFELDEFMELIDWQPRYWKVTKLAISCYNICSTQPQKN
jgi:hypothetical protein